MPDNILGIVPQTQPTDRTCVQTCLAMALDIPVEDVIEIYGEGAMNQETLCCALTDSGVVWNQLVHGTLVYKGWYFVTVPSLNKVGGNHQILLHYDDKITIIDPAIDKKYKEDGSDLISWSYLTPFWPGGKLFL